MTKAQIQFILNGKDLNDIARLLTGFTTRITPRMDPVEDKPNEQKILSILYDEELFVFTDVESESVEYWDFATITSIQFKAKKPNFKTGAQRLFLH